MKALSVRQPWAYALVDGAKTLEIRGWKTEHRGRLLICASKAPNNVFWRSETEDGREAFLLFPAGCMIGVVDVLGCRPMTEADAGQGGSMVAYTQGAWAWEIVPAGFCVPKAITGRLNLFDVDDALVEMLPVDSGWLFDYDPPQGKVALTKKSPIFSG